MVIVVNKKRVIILASIICLFIVAGVVIFVILANRTIEVESIEVSTDKVIIEYDGIHKVNYKIKPDNATNKEVIITSEKGLLTNDGNPEEFQAINNRVHGVDQICITSVSNDSIKTCYDVYIKPKPFSQIMEELGYTHIGYVYTKDNGTYTDELNVNEGYLKTISSSNGAYIEYKYYYEKGYGESVQKIDGYTVNWLYREDTNRATCAASAYYSTFCNYTSESIVINSFSTSKEYVKTLIRDYSKEELLT